MKPKTYHIIDHIKSRIHLSDAEVKKINSKLIHRKYLKGQYIGQERDVSKYQTYIVSGKVRTFYLDEKGQEHIVAFGFGDWWVGDIASFTTQTPAELNIQCITDTEVVQISYPDMEELYHDVPKLERYFRIIIQAAYGSMSKRIIRNHSLSAKERYLLLTQSEPNITQLVPQYMVASYLGVTKEFLSNIKKQIQSESKS